MGRNKTVASVPKASRVRILRPFSAISQRSAPKGNEYELSSLLQRLSGQKMEDDEAKALRSLLEEVQGLIKDLHNSQAEPKESSSFIDQALAFAEKMLPTVLSLL